MKVAVCNPPWPGEGYGARSNVRWPHRRADKHLAFPVYLAYTSAVLREQGFEVLALDAVEKELGIDAFVERLTDFAPELVLLEVSTPSLMYDLETAIKLKNSSGCRIYLAGPHASYFHEELVFNYRFIDGCIRNQFEICFPDICKTLRQQLPLANVNGLTWKNENNEVVVNDRVELDYSLDDLPLPDRDSFCLENYQQAFYCGRRSALLLASRGCPYHCVFCVWPQTIGGHKYRARSPRKVVDELLHLKKAHAIDSFFFDDDTFALDKERVKRICREIIDREVDLPWVCMGRVNAVDKETLDLMKLAGCTQIFYGFESGSDVILQASKKKVTRQQMLDAVQLTQAAGMIASGSFIFGLPDENRNTVRETIRFARRLQADFVQFTLAAPFPGTVFYEQARAEGLLCLNSWADFDGTKGAIIKTRSLSQSQLAGVVRRAYLSYYTCPGVIWLNLRKIRNLSELWRVLRGVRSIIARIFYYNQ